MSPWTKRLPRLTWVSDGKDRRRLLDLSKAGEVVGVMGDLHIRLHQCRSIAATRQIVQPSGCGNSFNTSNNHCVQRITTALLVQAAMTSANTRIASFKSAAKEAREAQLHVKEAFKAGLRDRDPAAYQSLLAAFRTALGAAWPFPPRESQRYGEKIRRGDDDTIDTVIIFLAADPYFFRSGYLKQVILRRLKQAPLTQQQKAKLQTLVLDAITQPHRFQFADYARLATAIASADFLATVEALSTSENNDGIRQRAMRVFELAKLNQPKKERT
jgi:hypothetical protein